MKKNSENDCFLKFKNKLERLQNFAVFLFYLSRIKQISQMLKLKNLLYQLDLREKISNN